MKGLLGEINGHKVIEVKPLKVEIKRTWKERLFGLPWRPWVKFRYEFQDVVEDGKCMMVGGMLYMNMKTLKSVENAIKIGGTIA